MNIQFVSCIHPPPSIPRNNTHKVDNCEVYYGKSVVLVLILSQEASKQLAPSVVTGDNPTFPVQKKKALSMASEQSYSNVVCTCLQT